MRKTYRIAPSVLLSWRALQNLILPAIRVLSRQKREGRMYRKIILAAALLALGACASTQDLLQEKPTATLDTTASPDQVRDCIVARDITLWSILPHEKG